MSPEGHAAASWPPQELPGQSDKQVPRPTASVGLAGLTGQRWTPGEKREMQWDWPRPDHNRESLDLTLGEAGATGRLWLCACAEARKSEPMPMCVGSAHNPPRALEEAPASRQRTAAVGMTAPAGRQVLKHVSYSTKRIPFWFNYTLLPDAYLN